MCTKGDQQRVLILRQKNPIKTLPSRISQPINQRKRQMWRFASRQSGRPLLRLDIPSYVKHSYAMTRKFYNSNGDSPYANGFPVLAEGLDTTIPRTSAANLILAWYMSGFETSRRSLSCGVGESVWLKASVILGGVMRSMPCLLITPWNLLYDWGNHFSSCSFKIISIWTFIFLPRLNVTNYLLPSYVIKHGSVRQKNGQYAFGPEISVPPYWKAQTRLRPVAHSCASRAWFDINTSFPGDLQPQSQV